jgi:glutathione S-transferase
MARKRLLVNTVFLSLAPLLVAWLDLGLTSAAALVLLLLLWRWVVKLSGLVVPENSPAIVLESISVSHYVEKVRWCMDRLDLDYTERHYGGTLGAFFTGRTVPRLRVRTGAVQSVIGNSPEILRFLWGAYGSELGDRAAFLEPARERLELEKQLDRYGRYLQVWIYSHMLQSRRLTLRLWGAEDPLTPGWQRQVLKILYPLLKLLISWSFRINEQNYTRAVQHVDDMLGDIDTRLADGRPSILGGETLNYTDIAFAALSGAWLMPDGYGAGKADGCLIERGRLPERMRADIDRWSEDYPRATAFIERLYTDERERTN